MHIGVEVKQRCSRVLSGARMGGIVLLVAIATAMPAKAFHGAWDVYSHLNDVVRYLGELFSNDAGKCSGSPVYGREGEFFFPEQDVVLAGRPALGVTRTYNSKDPTSGMFGNGWSSNCEVRLVRTIYDETAEDGTVRSGVRYVLRTADGRRRHYDRTSDGAFATPAGRDDRIVIEDDGTARLVERTGDYRRFDTRGRLVQAVDRNGNAIDYGYDDSSQLTTMSDANGRSLTFAYDTAGRVASITDHGSRTWQFDYDASGNLVSRTDPLGGQRLYAYQAYDDPLTGHVFHQLVGVTDETSVELVQIAYTEDRVASYTINENVYTYAYNRDGSTSVTDSARSSWTYSYAPNGMLASIAYPDGTRVSYDTDEDGNVVALTDQDGNVWNYDYADSGDLLSVTDPLSQTSSFDHVDGGPWITGMTSPVGRAETISYDERGNPLTARDAAGNVTRYRWSGEGDLLGYTDALEESESYEYNAIGLLTSETNALGETTTYRYDALGRLTGVTLPEGQVVATAYDELDRVASETDPLGQSSAYTYDAAGRVLQLTDAGGNVTAYDYDGFGRLVTETRPDGQTLTYTYRVDNLLETSTDPRGVVTTYGYDLNKRLTSMVEGSETSRFRYDRRGNLLSGSNPDAAVSYTYDALGRVLSESVGSRTTSYGYNADSDVVEVGTAGETWRYTHDERGLTTGFETPTGTHRYAYDAVGQPVEHVWPNGRRVTWDYDAVGQLVSQDDSAGGGALYRYSYDMNGRITGIDGDGAANWSYGYDDLGRLISADHLDSFAYSYDSLGNRLDRGGRYDEFNKLLADDEHDYTYDAAGNIATRTDRTTGETVTYSYNGRGRLRTVSVTAPGATSATLVATYGYDVRGRLVSRTMGREETQFLWAGDLIVGEYSGRAAAPSNVYRYGDGGWTATEYADAAGTYYVQDDYLNTPRYLTNEAGAVVWSNRMTPYGIDRLDVDSDGDGMSVRFDQRFPGQYADVATGFNYNRARYYDPATGRYVSSDPIGIAGGVNTYQYAYGSPNKFIDPSGNLVWFAVGAGMAALTAIDLHSIITNKCTTGFQKTAAVVFNVAPIGKLKWIGRGLGKAKSGLTRLVSKVRPHNVSRRGTETVQRAMSRAELEAIKNSGVLSRGGRPGPHYVSDAVNSSANRARQRLSLPQTPEVRVTMEVPQGVFSRPRKVKPDFNMPGGGMERTAPGSLDIPVKIRRIDDL